jgi:hypothetical protein
VPAAKVTSRFDDVSPIYRFLDRWGPRQQLRLAIMARIEGTYHRGRRQHVLGRLTPIEFETIKSTTTSTAAQENE